METAAKLAVTVRAMTSSPSTPPPRSEHPTAYHYAGIVAVIAVLLLVSNVIVIGCCSPSSIMEAIRSCFRSREASSSSDRESGRRIPVSKYRKCGDSDNECSVCLSVFVDGEDVRQLPQCKHSFHAPCIDMWLYSHTACPLCRTNVSAPPPTASRQSTRSDDVSMANVGVASPVR